MLFVNGKWGSGKTQTIKAYFLKDGSGSRYSHAYASLAGITSIESLKRRILSNLLVSENGLLSKIDNKIRPFLWLLLDNMEELQDFAPKELKPLNLNKLSKALIDPSLQRSSFVIVLDDAEKCILGNPDELLAFLSFIKESTECKLIIIGNALIDEEVEEKNKKAGEIIESNDDDIHDENKDLRFASALLNSAEWSHKIIDQVLRFELSPKDICELFTKEPATRTALADFLQVTNMTDLRKLRKAIEIAEIVAGRTGKSSKHEVLLSTLYIARAQLKTTGATTKSHRVMNSITPVVDDLIVKHLKNGHLTEADSLKMITSLREREKKQEIGAKKAKFNAIADMLFYSFATKSEIETAIMATLDEADEIPFFDLCNFRLFLELNEFTEQGYITKLNGLLQVSARIVSEVDMQYYTLEYHDERFRNIAKNFQQTHSHPDIIEIIEKFDDNQMKYLDAIQYLAPNQSADDVISIANRKNILTLKEIYRFVHDISSYASSLAVLNAILDDIAARSTDNNERVLFIKKLSD